MDVRFTIVMVLGAGRAAAAADHDAMMMAGPMRIDGRRGRVGRSLLNTTDVLRR